MDRRSKPSKDRTTGLAPSRDKLERVLDDVSVAGIRKVNSSEEAEVHSSEAPVAERGKLRSLTVDSGFKDENFTSPEKAINELYDWYRNSSNLDFNINMFDAAKRKTS